MTDDEFIIPDPEAEGFDPGFVRAVIQQMQPLDAIDCIKDVRQQWSFAIERMTKDRMDLPLSERNKKAKVLAAKIEFARRAIQSLRPLAIDKQGKVEKQQEHHAWANAVRELFGQDAVRQCYELMRKRKKEHAALRPQVPSGPVTPPTEES